MKYVEVAINLPVKNLFKQFTYSVAEELDFISVGWRVIVPFGHQTVEGFVVREVVAVEEPAKYKGVLDTLDTKPWFDDHMLATAIWLSEYYLCSLAEAMRLFIPGKSGLARAPLYTLQATDWSELTTEEEALCQWLSAQGRLGRKAIEQFTNGAKLLKSLITKKIVVLEYEITNKLKAKTINVFTLTTTGSNALTTAPQRMVAQRAALAVLQQEGALEAAQLSAHDISAATMRILCNKGWAEKSEQRVLRDSYANRSHCKENFVLTTQQTHAVARIVQALVSGTQQTFLLQGVTGSGKTEVYLRVAAEAVAAGKQVMVLVPEIALTGQIVKRFKSWFGQKVAVAHSKLSQNERADVWQRLRIKEADVLIGVRSAVFAPFASLGLIIVDEEHESSYKQEERPNYHAKAVAIHRAELLGIPVVLGSATPDICSYYQALQGNYQHLLLQERANHSQLPQVQIVDMRAELQSGNKSVLSRSLQEGLLQTVEQGGQAIVLLNRRGFSTFVLCRDCGEAISCPHCAVAMVYHSTGEFLQCHYCGETQALPDECPHCHSRRIKYFGTGTQKAETEISQLNVGIKVLRMDQDSTSRKFAHEDILKNFADGRANVLLGTQMVAKGHDIANVTLVGILSADSQLNLPDFRAGERTFALLTQAAGRAGRGEKPGVVILQTYDADNAIIKLAATQDYDTFAHLELSVREELNYPPFSHLLKITVLDAQQQTGTATAQRLVNLLQAAVLTTPTLKLEVMGPFPAIVAKVRDLYRINVLVKSEMMNVVKTLLLHSEFREMKNVCFDVDPVSVI
ncbi:MAG: primosomal protein N' [Acidaminococcaceae bacterium]